MFHPPAMVSAAGEHSVYKKKLKQRRKKIAYNFISKALNVGHGAGVQGMINSYMP
jgi:hypothetical protein